MNPGELPPLDVPSLPPDNIVVGEQNIIPESGDYNYIPESGDYNYVPAEAPEQDYGYNPADPGAVPSAPEFKEDE